MFGDVFERLGSSDMLLDTSLGRNALFAGVSLGMVWACVTVEEGSVEMPF